MLATQKGCKRVITLQVQPPITYISPDFHNDCDNVLLVGNTLVHSILYGIELEDIGHNTLEM